ncbi:MULTISPECIES: hypothetical protein [Brevibacillus]|uniref:hypothetical protein n=1 Tax=Brevibacillus TaxID=55080 RepID=UPI0007AC0549|nr:hypothetical protein AV540_09970 [Brevibacillus parabrevis]
MLNGHSAAKYGVPFAKLLRDSFGVDAIGKMDNPFAVIVLILALHVGAIGFVVFGNLLPAGLQMTALFPKWFTV